MHPSPVESLIPRLGRPSAHTYSSLQIQPPPGGGPGSRLVGRKEPLDPLTWV